MRFPAYWRPLVGTAAARLRRRSRCFAGSPHSVGAPLSLTSALGASARRMANQLSSRDKPRRHPEQLLELGAQAEGRLHAVALAEPDPGLAELDDDL